MYLGEDRPAATVHSELMDPVRILLVDDHLMVTEALASRLVRGHGPVGGRTVHHR